MAEWEAANVSSSDYDDDETSIIGREENDITKDISTQDPNHATDSSLTKRRRNQKVSSETPEAAIARLTSAYNAAMNAVGALHKASMAIAKSHNKDKKRHDSQHEEKQVQSLDDNRNNNNIDIVMDENENEQQNIDVQSQVEDKEDEYDSLKRVAMAARHAFENALLSDPILMSYTPSLTKARMKNNDNINVDQIKSSTTISKAHQITVKELAYLSLVNYADLILSCCSCGLNRKSNHDGILDRGAVRVLHALLHRHESMHSSPSLTTTISSYSTSHCSLCLWNDIENEEESKRIALVSYCDAVDLDGTDPTSWLKLACGARALSRVLQVKHQQPNLHSDITVDMGNDRISSLHYEPNLLHAIKNNLTFNRLERFALECGLNTLRPGMPPNKALYKAFQELEENMLVSSEPYISIHKRCQEEKKNEVVIDLPRYSWSTLGLMLLQTSGMTNAHTVSIKISPLLTLPKIALGNVCEYLGLFDEQKEVSPDVKNLGATCHTISEDIITARALLLKDRQERMKQTQQETGHLVEGQNEKNKQNISESIDLHHTEKPGNSKGDPNKSFRSRSSKRVQSQLLTSGKQAERNSKRNSVEYCLFSSIIPCTTDSPIYKELLKDFDWDGLESFASLVKILNDIGTNPKNINETTLDKKNLKAKTKMQTGKKVSLNDFLSRWGKSNAGARHLLQAFLVYVSCHIEDVFSEEQVDTTMLTSCISECLGNLTGSKVDSNSKFQLPWYGTMSFDSEKSDDVVMAMENLAINTLHAELLLRNSEHQELELGILPRNFNIVKVMIPHLLQFASSLNECEIPSTYKLHLTKLNIRIEWLATIFYDLFSKRCRILTDEKEAENLAIEYLDNAISQLQMLPLDTVIKTPHLEAPGRVGNHWSELTVSNLIAFRNDLEASSVLSNCRQKLFELLSTWRKAGGKETSHLSENDKIQLKTIGLDLLDRYQLGTKEAKIGENTSELIDEFLTIHKCLDLDTESDDCSSISPNQWPNIWQFIPTELVPITFDDLSKSSLLTWLSLILLSSEDHKVSQARFFESLILTAFKQIANALPNMYSASYVDTAKVSNDEISSYSNDMYKGDRNNCLVQMIHFLVAKLWGLCQDSSSDELLNIINVINIEAIIQLSIEISSGHSPLTMHKPERKDHMICQNVPFLKTTLAFSEFMMDGFNDEESQRRFTSGIFASLCHSLVREKIWLPYYSHKGESSLDRLQRAQKCEIRSHYIVTIASLLSKILTKHRNHVVIKESFLIKDFLALVKTESSPKRHLLCSLVKLIHSLAWYWTYISNNDIKQIGILRIPVAAVITGLIACSGFLNSNTINSSFSQLQVNEASNQLSLSDYFETDDSAKCYFENDTSERKNTNMIISRRACLQALCRSVQCIDLVFSSCDDADMSSNNWGNFLPLIVSKVLGDISDFVLEHFSEDKMSINKAVWVEEYPFGFRRSGAQLDVLLYKAYQCLYGVDLSMQHSNNIKSSAQLYRCLMRTYKGGRKTISTDVLECILSALPEVDESPVLIAVKNYLRQNEQVDCQYPKESQIDILDPRSNIDTGSTLSSSLLHELRQDQENDMNNEVYIVRKGICEYLAEGSLPTIGSGSISKQEESGVTKERELASQAERAVCKKFNFIIDSLNYEPTNPSRWYRAGLCLGVKIDIIMDRLANVNNAYNSSDFYLKGFPDLESRDSEFQNIYNDSQTLTSLIEKQYNDYLDAESEKDVVLGNDCFAYIDSEWSNFSSLRTLCVQLGNSDSQDDLQHWSMIQSKFDEGNYIEWQHIMGRMFVNALQKIREKCFKVAFLFSKMNDDDRELHAEIAESIGTMYYSDIEFSPRRKTVFEVRQRCLLAQHYFEHSLKSILQNEQADQHDLAEFELLFMIGKCQEKVAKTLQNEAYKNDSSIRVFEGAMLNSLKSYQKALTAVEKHEREHGAIDIQGGGSAHGIFEMIYRLHASRLKVLLHAVRKSRSERVEAEKEALRITESYWFEPKETVVECDKSDISQRIWAVLADIIESMAHCSKEQPFFHRSNYRHAQALMWAPLFHDPNGAIQQGSMSVVPAHKSYRLRGLSSGSCAMSAETILNALFDKKRPQLCAVWVTTPPSPSPFEYINDSSRKFDRLRMKYIGAFVDCMKLCKRRSTLETLIKWCHASSRDLPSFYQLTAEDGESPHHSHSVDNLMQKRSGFIYLVMKYANAAVASIIYQEAVEAEAQHITDEEWKTRIKELFGEAFKCFSRLNCPITDPLWQTAKVKKQVSNCEVTEVETICSVFMALHGIRSNESSHVPWEHKMLLLHSAIKEAHQLFPSLVVKSISTIHKKKRKRKE